MGGQSDQGQSQSRMYLEEFDCAHFQDCAAPLCPKDIEIKDKMWFPDEPICRLKIVPEWVRKEKKIARLKDIDCGRYFTVRMINSCEQIKKDIQGADPDLVTGEKIWQTSRTEWTVHQPARRSRNSKDTTDGEVGNYRLF